jgi:hypothetical protein
MQVYSTDVQVYSIHARLYTCEKWKTYLWMYLKYTWLEDTVTVNEIFIPRRWLCDLRIDPPPP